MVVQICFPVLPTQAPPTRGNQCLLQSIGRVTLQQQALLNGFVIEAWRGDRLWQFTSDSEARFIQPLEEWP